VADGLRGRFSSGRHAGVLVPLFSIPSGRSWGIGEIPDLVPLSRWLHSSGLDFVQLLPVNEMQEGQSSPYSALTAMAIDPIFIALDDVEDWTRDGNEAALGAEARAALDFAREAPRVNYAARVYLVHQASLSEWRCARQVVRRLRRARAMVAGRLCGLSRSA
jgi:4-alpha-glucanotransferase